jgi:TolB-like protein
MNGLLVAILVAAAPSGKPRLAFIELTPGADVSKEVAQAAGEQLVVALAETGKFDVITKGDVKAILGYEAQAQLLGCGEASCMVDLGGALGAAYLVSGSLARLGGQLQLVLSLIDVSKATVGRRVALPAAGDGALPQAAREAVQKLTGEVVPESGVPDACPSPPCAREAIAACKRWWEKEWEALTIVGVVPAGPWDQFLHEKVPARSFPLVVRTRARNGARSEYFASVRFKKVDGDWYFDEAGMRHLRELPIEPDDPPDEAALAKLLAEGYSAAHAGARILKLTPGRYPDYDREAHSWSYVLDVTYRGKDGKTQICPRAEAKVEHSALGKPWKFLPGREMNCEVVLDAQ